MLNAQIVNLKRQGKENVQHKPVIEPEDLVKLNSSDAITVTNPLGLLRNVWFNVVLYFCRRGREGQRSLRKSSFKFEQDAQGRCYVTMAHDEATKNHPGGVDDVQSSEKHGRMYKTQKNNDGYTAMRLYIEKLNPKCEAFFQYPKKNWSNSDAVWYENRPLGVNKLDNMMKEISQSAKLSRSYTNHCVRATAITLWSNAGIANRHIMSISGHRNEQSIAHYNCRPSTQQLHSCSEVLSRGLATSAPPATVEPGSVIAEVKTSNIEPDIKAIFHNCSINHVQVHLGAGCRQICE